MPPQGAAIIYDVSLCRTVAFASQDVLPSYFLASTLL